MHIPRLFIILALTLPLRYVVAQNNITVSNKLPAASIELYSQDPPTSGNPWQLPKPGDLHYDEAKEALTKDLAHTHVVHVFEHGVFTGYTTLTTGPLSKNLAQEQRSQFVPNSKLAADAVELSPGGHPNKGDFYLHEPTQRPANVPVTCMLVRVFQSNDLVGWTYMPKEAVSLLHQSNKR